MSTDNKCFFCNTTCRVDEIPSLSYTSKYLCDYCGEYLLDPQDRDRLSSQQDNKFKIACVLNERRLKGLGGIALNDKTDVKDKVLGLPRISIDDILDDFPKKPSDFLDRALLNLSRLAKPTQPFGIIRLELTTNKDYLHFFTPDKQGCHDFLRGLVEQGYIRFNRVQGGEQLDVFCLTTKCWDKVENLQKEEVGNKQAFEQVKAGAPTKTKQGIEPEKPAGAGQEIKERIETMRNQVFICYSHKDKRWLEDLQTHLKPYVRNGLITTWSDKQIAPGSKWLEEIKAALVYTKVAVLLVSPNFLASDFIHENELGPLLKKAEKGKVTIIWIPVRACSYKESPLKDYQAAVDPEKPLANMKAERDKAWVKICEEIKKTREDLMGEKKAEITPKASVNSKDITDQSEVQLMARVIRNEIIKYLRPSWLRSKLLITELSKSFPKHSVVDELHRMKEDGLVSWDSESLEDNPKVSLTKTKS